MLAANPRLKGYPAILVCYTWISSVAQAGDGDL
jgi:hypothetical protein